MTEKPYITCLCPTYGRFEQLRDAVACFLLQDYLFRHLLILNDAPHKITLTKKHTSVSIAGVGIGVLNVSARYPHLGAKRQFLLQQAGTPLVAHWDDDDWYLPWHLSHCVSALLDKGFQPLAHAMVKPRGAWWAVGPRDSFEVKGPKHNVFEGQLVFDRQAALDLGGYPPKVSGQAKALMDKFIKARRRQGVSTPCASTDRQGVSTPCPCFYRFDPYPFISYVYRWGDGLCHISGGGDNEKSHKDFAARNTDFGDGQPLIPGGQHPREWARARMAPLFDRLLDGIRKLASQGDYERVEARLRPAYATYPQSSSVSC